MKTIAVLILCFLFGNLYSQEAIEKEIKTDVNEVTVFIENAQITRTKTVSLLRGITLLKFIDLSPFIDAKSVQVEAEGDVTVLSVNHQQNYIDKIDKPQELIELEAKLQTIEDKIHLQSTYLSVISEELAFLKANRSIGGKNQELSVSNLKAASEFYSARLTALKIKEIERNKTLQELNKQKRDLEKQINALTGKKEFAKGEIVVKVDSKMNSRATFALSYVVGNTGWLPSYDIRAKNINEPIGVVYKANVRQDTKVDWTNVKLKFSSSDPNISGIAPELKPYFLNYNSIPPTYRKITNSVTGRVMDQNGKPLPGTTVMVEGTMIGTITDQNGKYSITTPSDGGNLAFSFVGCQTQTLPIRSSIMNVSMKNDNVALEEVVVMGYGNTDRDDTGALAGRVAGVSIRGTNRKERKSSKMRTLPVPSIQIENQTTVDFEIKTPYTIKSDNKNYSVDMDLYYVNADYQYYSVPKIDKDAFLLANITDWEKYNLLEGEANIYFEDKYIGKTLLDTRYASDTLQISLGRDKNVSINRKKVHDFTSKQFIGNKKEVSREWLTTVKNNKSQKINIRILDQIPVSTLEEIEVEVQKKSNAKHDKETGEIKWEFSLEPRTDKKLELKYSVKYPKYRNLVIE